MSADPLTTAVVKLESDPEEREEGRCYNSINRGIVVKVAALRDCFHSPVDGSANYCGSKAGVRSEEERVEV